MLEDHDIRIYLSDERLVEDFISKFNEHLLRRSISIEAVCRENALGLSKWDAVLTITLSFGTSVAANIATPHIHEALGETVSALGEVFEVEDFTIHPGSPEPDRSESDFRQMPADRKREES